jgi:hypothetical protein
MKVELLFLPDCPNVSTARHNLAEALIKAGHVLVWKEIDLTAPETPAELRAYGSPTILVDGRDVVGKTAPESALSCRTYFKSNGGITGAPTVDVIIKAFNGCVDKTSDRKIQAKGAWKRLIATFPVIAFALLPTAACPACWPVYAGLISSLD